ncbi:hypothetical protein JCM8547_004129, partial [Rhodosporidiobolus lusitaniae]
MLLDNVQPVLSLFSSTSSSPLLLASSLRSSSSTPEGSFISLLVDHDDSSETLLAWSGSSPAELEARAASLKRMRANQLEASSGRRLKELRGKVLHLQSPDPRNTSVKWGTWEKEKWRKEGLGVKLPVVHVQMKEMPGQQVYVDVGVVGEEGEVVVVRCSSWQ